MANHEHLMLLKQGMRAWNQWRSEHPTICPDFSGADLSEAFFPRYYFGGYITENLSIFTDFTNANLRKANFANADLRSANFSRGQFEQC
jgi:uncharacterized protein YjbI with pentapeptide repeats